METVIIVAQKITFFKFKSYYVVWKLNRGSFEISVSFKFKSYYVVWKPYEFGKGDDKIKEFKSYYVVWKLVMIWVLNFIVFSLNRTMQYGNPIWKMRRSGRAILFKSYYVVWKPRDAPTCAATDVLFKSYYVVWKQLFASASFMQVISLNRTMQYGNQNKVKNFNSKKEV